MLLSAILLGGICGWFLGYIRFPYMEQNMSFVLGCIFGIAIVIFILFARFVFKKNTEQTGSAAPNQTRVFSILILLIASAGLICSLMFYKQNNTLQSQIADNKSKMQDMSAIIQQAGSGNLAGMMQHILDAVQLQTASGAIITDTLLSQLAALSYTFTPYPYFDGDTIAQRSISPQRGQLLMGLLLMDIDSVSFQKIKNTVSFAGAQLSGADLHGVDLSGADLVGAHLTEANLRAANLNNARLSDALLYAAQLDSATMLSADLKRADLRWSTLHDADLTMADLNGAQMANAQFMHTQLYRATLQYAEVSNAIFYQSNLHSADLMGTAMQKTNFTEADMSFTNLRLVSPNDAIWNNTLLQKATVDSTWMQNMDAWHLIGKEEIRQHYQLVNDTVDQWKNPLHRLTLKSNN